MGTDRTRADIQADINKLLELSENGEVDPHTRKLTVRALMWERSAWGANEERKRLAVELEQLQRWAAKQPCERPVTTEQLDIDPITNKTGWSRKRCGTCVSCNARAVLEG